LKIFLFFFVDIPVILWYNDKTDNTFLRSYFF